MKQQKYKKGHILLAVVMVAGFVASIFLPVSRVAAKGALSTTLKRSTLQNYADRLHDAGITGVLLHARSNGDSLQVRSGVASLKDSEPVPWGAHFKTGSTTKTFVSTVMLQLEAEGKLSLDDTLQRWLPDVLGAQYDEASITLHNLLGHTSGIFDYTSDNSFLETILTREGFEANRFKSYTVADLINLAKAHPPVFAPGTSWEYSNTNYVLAGMVIKAVTGNDWTKEVKKRILVPLGLTETASADAQAGLPSPFAHAYHIYSTEPNARSYTDTTLHNMSWANAAGDLVTTTKDENRFFRALMKGQLLPPTQLAKMKTVVMLDEGLGYGLGIVWASLPCDSRGFWSHGGGVVGYSTGNGVTDDGHRSAVISLSTTSFSDETYLTQTAEIGNEMLSYALCGGQTTPSATSQSNRPAAQHIPYIPTDAAQQLKKRLRL